MTPRNFSGVSAVSVSPDGRRVALIAGGQAYVSSLSLANGSVTVGSTPRPILANQLTPATAVAWTEEAWLYVAGTSGGAPAMWHVTADSVVAENLSESLRGLRVDDLVAYPKGPGSGSAEVLAIHTVGHLHVLQPADSTGTAGSVLRHSLSPATVLLSTVCPQGTVSAGGGRLEPSGWSGGRNRGDAARSGAAARLCRLRGGRRRPVLHLRGGAPAGSRPYVARDRRRRGCPRV